MASKTATTREAVLHSASAMLEAVWRGIGVAPPLGVARSVAAVVEVATILGEARFPKPSTHVASGIGFAAVAIGEQEVEGEEAALAGFSGSELVLPQ